MGDDSLCVISSPDLLSPPIISQFVAVPTKKQQRKTAKRGRRRKRSSSTKREPTCLTNSQGGLKTKVADSNDEERLDEQKHSRAMELMYHLQQRQEQVSSIIQVTCSGQIMAVPAEAVVEELKAINEALKRLQRVFRTAKDELNNSQCFPKDRISHSSLTRKQLHMNTRLSKCNSLVKVQQELENQFEEVKDSLVVNSNHESCSGINGVGMTSDGSIVERSLLELEKSLLVLNSPGAISQNLPFQHPLYRSDSQSQRSQDILDDLFGAMSETCSIANSLTTPRCAQHQNTLVTFHGDKVFCSPPPKYTLMEFQREAETEDLNRENVLVGRIHHLDTAVADTSQAFEPSQQSPALTRHPPLTREYTCTQPLASSSQLQDDMSLHISSNLPPIPASTDCHIRYKKLVIQPSLKVAIISNGEITSLNEEPALKQLFTTTATAVTISDELLALLESWMCD